MEEQEYNLRRLEISQRKWETEYNSKASIEGQGYKGLSLINGGAAVALGALLQAIINKPEAATVIPYILTAIALNIAGITLASVIFWVRYNQWLYEKEHNKFLKDNPWWAWRWYLAGLSLLCFVVGMSIVVYGGFKELNLTPESKLILEPDSNSSSSRIWSDIKKYNGFYDWPLDKKISEASIIIKTKYKREGNDLIPVIVEIWKRNSGSVFPYKQGDNYSAIQKYEKNVDRGEGEIIFFTGKTARPRYSSTYRNGLVSGIDNMPIDQLKKQVLSINKSK